jgi:origin recognition complex subunit 3
MCHYYANPLSLFTQPLDDASLVQGEHYEAIRNLPSFQKYVEDRLSTTSISDLQRVLQDDDFLGEELGIGKGVAGRHVSDANAWRDTSRRALDLIAAGKLSPKSYCELYLEILSDGITEAVEDSLYASAIRAMSPPDIALLIRRLCAVLEDKWDGKTESSRDSRVVRDLTGLAHRLDMIVKRAEEHGGTLRSRYHAHNKVLRTTVVAQKVQLSQAAAALTAEDKDFTNIVDELVDSFCQEVHVLSPEDVFMNEVWLYDSRAPYKDVFIPRPGTVSGRALSRPHDYLGCSCCGGAKGATASTLPATCILYHLYLEAGALINVADLWSSFFALIGGDGEGDVDERTGLVLFYRALAELKLMGFVKSSRKKADHIAKVKWL